MFDKLGNSNENINHGDFMFYIADIFTLGVQYGQRTELCKMLVSEEFNKDQFAGLG